MCLADKVRQVKRFKAEKTSVNKSKKEQVAYADMEDNDLMWDVGYDYIKELRSMWPS